MSLPASWTLPETIQKRFGKNPGKQRAMLADEHLLLILHQVPGEERDRRAAFFWRQPDGAWRSSTSSSAGLKPLVRHVQAYSDTGDALEQRYDQAQCAEDYFVLLEQLAPVRLAAQNLHATLQAAREGVPSDRDLIDLRDTAYEIARTLDLLQEKTKNALDFRLAQRAEEQTRLSLAAVDASNRLNILAAIFFPLTAISCLFGMNLASGLEGSSATAFWFIFLFSIALGLLVRNWVVKGRWF